MEKSRKEELGELVINALLNVGQLRGSKSKDLVNYMIQTHNMPINEAKVLVRSVLKDGLKKGSVVKHNHVYLVQNFSDLATDECGLLRRRPKKPRSKCGLLRRVPKKTRSKCAPPRTRRRRKRDSPDPKPLPRYTRPRPRRAKPTTEK